jgi:hypothetical protein
MNKIIIAVEEMVMAQGLGALLGRAASPNRYGSRRPAISSARFEFASGPFSSGVRNRTEIPAPKERFVSPAVGFPGV